MPATLGAVFEEQQHHLVLIVARAFASRLATAVFLVDPEGTAIYFNEAAENLLGRPFIEGHGMPASIWSTQFAPQDDQGRPIPLEELPLGIALGKRVPAHRAFGILGLDGALRSVAVTAFPLFAHTEEFVGAMAIFWERSEGS
jgi:PAS domain-containing protein